MSFVSYFDLTILLFFLSCLSANVLIARENVYCSGGKEMKYSTSFLETILLLFVGSFVRL